jgi:hypothetical protein
MKSKLLLLLLILSNSLANGQSGKTPAAPDLSKFSSDQLKACYEDKKICGIENDWEISEELANRLPAFSTKQLIACFADWKICGVSDGIATGWPISDELAHRGNPHEMLVHYWTEPNHSIRDGIVHVAYHFKNPEVTAFMRKVLAESKGEDEDLYWPANYLAKRCAPDGLKWLSSKPQRSQGCMQFATTIPLFGKCRYRPAIPYLISSSLGDACLNIVDAAEVDLRTMYPHSPKEFDSIADMQKYYCARARKEGFDVQCRSK